MVTKRKEIKKITLSWILSWIFGVLFILLGLGVIIVGSYVRGIFIMLFSAMIIPYFNKIISKKLHFKISGGIKFALVIVILILFGFAISGTADQGSTTQKTEYFLNERIVHGDFAYTVHSIENVSELGRFFPRESKGVFLIVELTVENIAKESEYVYSDRFNIVDDQGRVFDKASSAGLKDDFKFSKIQPGLSESGKIAFDVVDEGEYKLRIRKGIFSSDYVYVKLN
ncbi:MAG: DUF4352 domain-containing protein [Nanoarchaeota archaeon]|nr:DUF4352 domain-containing protein [Nanoarchaeota archaeon]